jgi:Ca-activated chloride channel family protein
MFNPGIPGKLFFATDDNKKAAERFVNSVEARLSTDHLPALLMAVGMGADVIFFLTDGEDPSLSSVELDQIARRNAGRSAIHVIQFGTSSPSQDNWLMRLARQNDGQYKFFDIHRLSPRE